MKIKFTSLLIVLTLCLQLFTPVFAAEVQNKDGIAYISFGTEGEVTNLKAWMPQSPEVVEKSGQTGWKLTGSSAATRYIYVDIADNFMNKLCGESVYVEVEYFDEGNNTFLIEYDSPKRKDAHSEYVDLKNTLAWKKHTFFLQDALFNNNLENADLRLAVYSGNLGNGGNVLIGSVRIYFGDKKSPIDIVPTTKVPGNIFLEGEDIEFDITYTNKTKETFDYTLKYTAVNMENKALWTHEEPISFKAEEQITKALTFQMPEFGMHWLRIELLDKKGESYCIKDAEFSYITSGRLNPRSGTSTHTDMHITKYGDDNEVSRMLAGCGYGNIRFSWMWYYTEQQKPGDYVLQPHFKKLMQKYKEKGVEQIAIIGFNHSYSPYSNVDGFRAGALTPYYEQQFRNYVRNIVADSKDYVKYYILGNETDHPGEYTDEERAPKYHVQRMKIAYETIKEEYPEAVVVGLAPTMTDIQWIRDVFALGAGNYMDVATMHPYAAYESLEDSAFVQRMQEIRKIADDNGCTDLPIWITENGWIKSRFGIGRTDLYRESQQLVRMNVYAEAYDIAQKVVDYMFPATNTTIQQSLGYGHLSSPPGGTNDVDLPYSPYRSYTTIAAWNKNFGGTGTIEKRFDEDTSNIRAYCFKRNDKDERFIAMWALDGRENVTFDLGCESVELMDCYGNKETIYGTDGKYTFNLDGDSTYVIGNFAKCEMLAEHVFAPQALEVSVCRDSSKTFMINAPSVSDGYTVETECYGNAVSQGAVFNGGKAELEYLLTEKEHIPADDYLVGSAGRSQYLNMPWDALKDYIMLSVTKDGKKYYKMKLPIEEISPVTVESDMYPYSKSFLRNYIAELSLHNQTDVAYEGVTLNIVSPSEWAEVSKPISINLAPGETKDIMLHVPEQSLSEKFLLGVEIKDKDGNTINITQKEYPTSCAVFTDTPPTIDAVLDEWDEDSSLTVRADSYKALMKTEPFNGSDDLSAKLMFQWDDDYLYFAARVTDDILKQGYKDGGTWRADGFQIGFDVSEDGNEFSHIMLALSDDGYHTLYSFASEDSSYPRGLIEGSESKYVREGNVTIYEAKIPMDAIMPMKNFVSIGDGVKAEGSFSTSDERFKPENSMTIKFSALINDDDGAGRKGYIEYGNGVSAGSSAAFAGLYFLK